MTTRRTRILATVVALGAAVVASAATAAEATTTAVASAVAAVIPGATFPNLPNNVVFGRLSGLQERPATVTTAGSGDFLVEIDPAAQVVRYRLSYTALGGTVTQAHIHFGSSGQAGGVIVFLCSNLGNGPAGTQACPAAPGTVTGTLKAAQVIGPSAQGIARRRVRRIRLGHPGREDLRERAQHEISGRRDPGPARRAGCWPVQVVTASTHRTGDLMEGVTGHYGSRPASAAGPPLG